MMSAVAPIWDGNETWLVVAGVVLWGAFPVVYATLFSAFYLPLLLMLAGLILRGVAFEYRNKTERLRWIWDASFAGGSLVAAFIQGMTVGALVRGASDHQWPIYRRRIRLVQPLCGAVRHRPVSRLCLLGACWLVRKCDGDVREAAYRLIPVPGGWTARFLWWSCSPTPWPRTCGSCHRWLERPYLFVFPAIGIVAAVVAAASVRRRRDEVPFYHGRADFRRGLRHAGDLVLALHDPVLDHDRRSRLAPFQSRLHVLGRRPLRLPADADLHRDQFTVFKGKVRPTTNHY